MEGCSCLCMRAYFIWQNYLPWLQNRISPQIPGALHWIHPPGWALPRPWFVTRADGLTSLGLLCRTAPWWSRFMTPLFCVMLLIATSCRGGAFVWALVLIVGPYSVLYVIFHVCSTVVWFIPGCLRSTPNWALFWMNHSYVKNSTLINCCVDKKNEYLKSWTNHMWVNM